MTWSYDDLSSRDQHYLGMSSVMWLFAFVTPFIMPKTRNMGSGEAWYESKKSALTPPSWVFFLVWICLYAGMAWSLFEVMAWGGGSGMMVALIIVNWILASVWPFVFVYQNFKAAFAIIILMIVTLVLLLYFHITMPDSEMSSIPMVVYGAYIAWLCFAAVLTYPFM